MATDLTYFTDDFTTLDAWTQSEPISLSSGAVMPAVDTSPTLTGVATWDGRGADLIVHFDHPVASDGLAPRLKIQIYIDANNYVEMSMVSGNLPYLKVVEGGVATTLRPTNDDTADYWRIQERAGTYRFSRGATPPVWEPLGSISHTLDVSSVRVKIETYDLPVLSPSYDGYGEGGYGEGYYGGDDEQRDAFWKILAINPVTASNPVPAPVIVVEPTVWEWSVGTWDGTDQTFIPARDRNIIARLKEPSEATFTLDPRHPAAASIVPLVTDLWVRRNGEDVFRGRIVAPDDTVSGVGPTASFTAMDYREVLRRRLMVDEDNPDDPFVYEAGIYNYPEDILMLMIEHTQAKTNGDLGITEGNIDALPAVAGFTVAARTSIYDAETAIAESVGFDWDILPDMTANIWYPRGSVSDEVLHYGASVMDGAQYTIDSSEYANVVYRPGGYVASSDIATRPEGRWETAITDDADEAADTLAEDRAATYLAAHETLDASITLPIKPGKWGGPASLWLGDTVQYVIRFGRLDVVDDGRVFEMAIAINEENQELVTPTLNSAKVNIRKLLRKLAQRNRSVYP